MEWQRDRVGSALRGENPTVLARLPGSFAVFGDVQWLPGYCVLLTDEPRVPMLTSLSLDRQTQFLTSMAVLGQAVESACSTLDPAFRRLNYDILGNTDAFLHAHVWPRYSWEPAERLSKPVWLYPPDRWTSAEHRAGSRHDALRQAITDELVRLGASPVAVPAEPEA